MLVNMCEKIDKLGSCYGNRLSEDGHFLSRREVVGMARGRSLAAYCSRTIVANGIIGFDCGRAFM